MKLEQPDRIVKIKAQHLADAIDAIRQLCDELDEARHYCNDEDASSIDAQIKELGKLWDAISDAVE